MSSFILTDGKYYVMEDQFRPGRYLPTTAPHLAKQFTYKQTQQILQGKGKRYSQFRDYQRVNVDTNEVTEDVSSNYVGNGGIYAGDKAIEINEEIVKTVCEEVEHITKLFGWDKVQLAKYKEELSSQLSFYDSEISDILHALEKYRKENDGKNPRAHKMAKIGYMLTEIRSKRRNVKQCVDYIKVMQEGITYKHNISRLKDDLLKAEHVDYKGRTDLYKTALDILG